MANFVLVHPAWFGGWCWDKVATRLRGANHNVYTPTLTGLAEREHLARPEIGLAVHVQDVVAVLKFDDLHDVILVGTSSGGTVITGVAGEVPDRIRALVYIDAFVPAAGQCTLDLLPTERRSVLEGLVDAEGGGWRLPRFAPPPWPVIVRDIWQVTEQRAVDWVLPRLRPTPFRHFTEPIATAPVATGLTRVYIRCIRSGPAPQFDAAADMARSDPGWQCLEMDTYHVPYVTHPEDVVDALVAVAT